MKHPLTGRGAYKLYAGSAERDARLRVYGDTGEVRPGEGAYVRVTVSRPVVLDFKDSFVLREAGRKQTVAGGQVLDTDPPPKPGPDPEGRLAKRQAADRTELAWRLVADRGAVRASDVLVLAGIRADEAVRSGAVKAGPWLLSPELVEEVAASMNGRLVR